MTLSEYWTEVATALKANPEWTQGQAAMCVLHQHRLDLYANKVNDYLGLFYNDDNLPAFKKWLEENWNEA